MPIRRAPRRLPPEALYGGAANLEDRRSGSVPRLEFGAEHEFDAARCSGSGGPRIQNPGNPPETGRWFDAQVRSAAGDRTHACTRRFELGVVQQVVRGRAEIERHSFIQAKTLLQRRIDLEGAR